jgi:hypothetical protein
LLVIAFGLIISGLLYYRDNKFSDKPKSLIYSLAVLRFISAMAIAFFLLEPFYRTVQEDVRKPVLIVAQDASASINTKKGDILPTEVAAQLSTLTNELSSKYDTKLIHFGEQVETGLLDSFKQRSSNFDELFSYVSNQYEDMPVAGMILVSDGIYNIGRNPLYNENMLYPVYPIALGDTMKYSDISIKNVFYNPVSFLGDSLLIKFDINAIQLNGRKSEVNISKITNGQETPIKSKSFSIGSNDFFEAFQFNILASESGTMHFRLSVDPIQDREQVVTNNFRDIFIEIIDSRIRVLVVANSPHPDITAIKQSLENNKNFTVDIIMAAESPDLPEADVMILHNLPSAKYTFNQQLETIKQKKIPYLMVTGTQTDFNAMERSQDIIDLKSDGRNFNEAAPAFNINFKTFELDNDTKSTITQFPPLTAPYGEYAESSNSKTLLYQKIGSVNTNYPLLSFNDRNGHKTGILAGEGLWRWRLNEYGRTGQQLAFNQLLHKSMQYLSIKEDKRKWQVKMDKKVWSENERVNFKAILYNDNFEPINESEAKLILFHENGDQYDFNFSRNQDHYVLEAGYLQEGSYRYTAINDKAGEKMEYTGSFIVKALQIELAELQARHDVLNALAIQTGGRMFYPEMISELRQSLMEKEVRSVIFSSESYMTLLNLKWLFFVLLFLLSIEWFLRRYHGSY